MELASVIAMMAVAAAEALLLRGVACRLRSRLPAWFLLAFLLIAAGAAIGWVDVNVPLQNSHWRPAGQQIPWWIALLAWGARCGALFGLLSLAPLVLRATPLPLRQKSMK